RVARRFRSTAGSTPSATSGCTTWASTWIPATASTTSTRTHSTASAPTRRTAEMAGSIQAPGAPAAVGHYPHARRVGNLLMLSGIGPRDPKPHAIVGHVDDAYGNL